MKKYNLNFFMFSFIAIAPLLYYIGALFHIDFKVHIIMLLLLLLEYCYSITNKKLFFLFFIFCLIGLQFIVTYFHPNFFYILMFILFLLLIYQFTKKRKINEFARFIIKYNKIFLYVGVLFTLIDVLNLFLKRGWYYSWGNKSYISVFPNAHEAGYAIASHIAWFIVIYNFSNSPRKKYFVNILILLNLVLSFLTNARTVFFATLAIVFLHFRVNVKNNKIYYLNLFFLLIVVCIVNYYKNFIVLESIPIVNKFIYGIETNDLSSSRSLIWSTIMDYRKNNFGILDNVFGKGFGTSIKITGSYLYGALWSHNDFIEVLVSTGIIGMGFYINSYFKIYRQTRSLWIVAILIFMAFFNGLFIYSKFILSIPILILGFSKYVFNLKEMEDQS